MSCPLFLFLGGAAIKFAFIVFIFWLPACSMVIALHVPTLKSSYKSIAYSHQVKY
jgi:hypothetical protein